MVGVDLPLIEKKPRATGFWADGQLHGHQGPYFISFCLAVLACVSISNFPHRPTFLLELQPPHLSSRLEAGERERAPPRDSHLVLIYARHLGSEVDQQDTPPHSNF